MSKARGRGGCRQDIGNCQTENVHFYRLSNEYNSKYRANFTYQTYLGCLIVHQQSLLTLLHCGVRPSLLSWLLSAPNIVTLKVGRAINATFIEPRLLVRSRSRVKVFGAEGILRMRSEYSFLFLTPRLKDERVNPQGMP